MNLIRRWREYFRDETQREAIRHFHLDLRHVASRVDGYRRASDEVRLTVRAILAQRIDRASAANATPAFTVLMSVLGTVAGVLMGIYVSFFTVLLNAGATAPGLTSAQLAGGMRTIVGPIVWISLVLIGLSFFGWMNARRRDCDKAMATAWLQAYNEAEEKPAHLRPAHDRRVEASRTRLSRPELLRG